MELSYDESVKQLREWRNSNVRKSKEVVEIGEKVINKTSYSLFNDEIWLICEQLCTAALDVCKFDVAEQCLSKLKQNFPNSIRVMKLEAMRLEAIGDLEQAGKIYDELIKREPTLAGPRKRKVALWKSKGDTKGAIRELCHYLTYFMVDHEAWYELAQLYLKTMNYSKAAYCYEELILINTFNHLYHQRYAEIRYTMGGQENMQIAKKHFSQAVKLSSNTNMRALYGMLYTSYNIINQKNKQQDNSKTHAVWAAKMILKKYEDSQEKSCGQYVTSAKLMLKNLQGDVAQ